MAFDKIYYDYYVLASILRTPGAVNAFKKDVNPYDIGLPDNLMGIHQIYTSMMNYHDKINLDIVDPIGYAAWLESDQNLMDSMGGVVGVNGFIENLMELDLPPVEAIVKHVASHANDKRQINITNELLKKLTNKGEKTDVDKAKIIDLIDQIKVLESRTDYDPLEKVRTASDIANDVDNLWNIPPFLPTQFKMLNKAMGYDEEKGGFFRGGVHAVVALSGKGKSTLVKCLCNYWLDTGYTVLFINFEEAQPHWERVLMTQLIERNVYESVNHLSPQEKAKYTKIFKDRLNKWGDRFMVRHDPDSLFFEDIEKWLRDIIKKGARQPDIVVIDTIQSMFTKTGGRARWGDFEQIMVGLEKLAKDMDAAFIITAQQNINSTKEKREEINQSDMGGSVTITQKSTVTLFITPVKDAENDETISETQMQIQIPKNRITGTSFAGNPPVVVYRDDIKSYVDFEIVEDYNNDLIAEEFNNFRMT